MDDLERLRGALPSYDVGEVLGRGAWGVVVAGRHRQLGRAVAIKVLPLGMTRDPGVRQRFEREAKTLASLDHPHVVRVYDYVEQDEVCALIMEQLTGGSLGDRMRLARLSPQTASALEVAALHGLEHAHQQGVLHRDIKPENIMFTRDGWLKITDFGIATVLGDQAERLTATGTVLGTPAYMAPEQLDESQPVTSASDVWASGAVYYEMLAGDAPYARRATLQATLLARLNEDPRPLRELDPDVPTEVAEAAMRAIARDPADRWTSAGEFAEELERRGSGLWGADWLCATGTPVARTERAASADATGALTSAAPATALPRAIPPAVPRRGSRRRWLVPAAAATAVVLIAGGVALLAKGDDEPAHAGSGGSEHGLAPAGWPDRLQIGVGLPADLTADIPSHFGKGVPAVIGFSGDPLTSDVWSAGGGQPAVTQVRQAEVGGVPPTGYAYIQRLVGQGAGNDADADGTLRILKDPRLMRAYWENIKLLLTQLGSLDEPIDLVVESSVASNIAAAYPDATQVRAVVGSSGVPDLDGLPDTFAGWTQAWVRLRDQLAPQVQLGMDVESWGYGDFLIPVRPTVQDIDGWVANFKRFYASLGTKYDFLDDTVSYGEAGAQDDPQEQMPTPKDFDRLLAWVQGISTAAGAGVVLDSVPTGNTVYRTVNNTPYHYQDGYVEWLLGDDDYAHLQAFRDAGLIGIVFGTAGDPAAETCPCDAADDGVTNPPGTGREADSSDDDGGYLQEQVRRYLDGGGMPL
ncbi:serine/threonine-protein kinase [Nocardioides panacisoli]|uniref:Protein kinase domain-containing protein n=1 Tax=Nocardioides panacisoli TaxID=627624 RepID=A0ABP7IGJ4_9ACTN